MQLFRRILREPLIHFVALAGMLFTAQAIYAGDNREIIRVDKTTQDFLIKQRGELLLQDLTEEEQQETIENYVEEEILVREARKQGFDDSSRIRSLMVQNMRFFIGSDIGEPTEQELREFFEKNIDRFTSPPSLDMDQGAYRPVP